MTQVFTPASPAVLTFIERSDVNDQIVDSLNTPGKQIVVFGHSGSGKTTLLTNKLRQVYEHDVTISCTSDTTFQQVLLEAFDHLGPFYASGGSTKTTTKKAASVAGTYAQVRVALNAEIAREHGKTYSRVVELQITPLRLAEFLGEAHACLVLEDFHKVSPAEKLRIAEAMKVFVNKAVDYPDARLILVGAENTARQVIEYGSDMKTRVAEVAVRRMSDSEIAGIFTKAERLLNIEIPDKYKSEITRYSGGMASIAHQFGLNLCFAAGVYETAEERVTFSAEHLEKAVKRYVEDSSDSLRNAFDLALKRERTRKFDNCRLILAALAKLGPEGKTHNEILAEIRKVHTDYPSGNLTTYLSELQKPARAELVCFDAASKKYSFSDPIYFTHAVLTLGKRRASPFNDALIALLENALKNVFKPAN